MRRAGYNTMLLYSITLGCMRMLAPPQFPINWRNSSASDNNFKFKLITTPV